MRIAFLVVAAFVAVYIAAVCYVNVKLTFDQVPSGPICQQVVTDWEAAQCLRRHGIDPATEFGSQP